MEKVKTKGLIKKIAGIGLALTLCFTGLALVGCGKDGQDGENGAFWYTGVEAPTDEGKDGDFYIDTDDYVLYQKVDGKWEVLINNFGKPGENGENGESGEAGADGNMWHVGTTYPVTANVNDIFLNKETFDIYQYNGSEWEYLGNIKGESNENEDSTVVVDSANFMHLSFDDVSTCFGNLINNQYENLFDEPFFAWLKTLHETYGAKFSLYAYNSSLNNVSNKYAKDFFNAKDWLKIGLHAEDASSSFANSTYEQGFNSWNKFVDNVTRITGSYLSVDRMPRLHTFAGSEEALKGMRDANYGAIGFLSADDSRNSYYLDRKTNDYLYLNDHVTDYENGLVFVATDLRTDWFNGTSASYDYREPTKDNVYDELVERYTNVDYANSISSYILFGHEWQLYNGTSLTETRAKWFEDACKFANDYNIKFDYSQNKSFKPTSYDIYPTGQASTEIQATFAGEDVEIYNNISDMEFTKGKSLLGNAQGITNSTGRAACISGCLKVSGGELISLLDTIPDLQYSISEFTTYTMNSGTLTSGGQNSTQWLNENIKLQDDTKYIMIAFRNGDGSEDFTDEQINLLSQCLTVSKIEIGNAVYGGTSMDVVENISDMDFVIGKTFSGNASGISDTVGRAACVTACLKVNGGETLTLVENIDGLQYAICEFSSSIMTADNIVDGGQSSAQWLTGPIVLQDTTQYIIIAFKNGEGLEDFTEEQASLLSQCLIIS